MNTKYRKTIIAGNWKMNMLVSDIKPFIEELKPLLPKLKTCDTVLCVPAVNVPAMIRAGKEAKIACGTQDVSCHDKGAYTGEISAAQIADVGAKFCIVGHSERRAYHNETDLDVNCKAKKLLEHGVSPIICVGESLEQREAGLTMSHINYQVRAALSGVDTAMLRRCVIAYEPIWAIGTGKTATAEQAEEIHAFIRSTVAEKYGKEVAEETSILYGGSCKASNAPELFAKPDIDGGLIGGASLKVADFKGIIDAWK